MEQDYLLFNSRDELLRIDVSKIAYLEADTNYVNVITTNKLKGTVCINMTQMESALVNKLKEKSRRFVRIGKSYIVNMTYVYQINIAKQRLVLSDGVSFAFQLQISKEALKKLKDIFVKGIQ